LHRRPPATSFTPWRGWQANPTSIEGSSTVVAMGVADFFYNVRSSAKLVLPVLLPRLLGQLLVQSSVAQE
jgi:hypothetical protein